MESNEYKGAKILSVDMTEIFKNPSKYKNMFKSTGKAYLKKTTLNENGEEEITAIAVKVFPVSDHWAMKIFQELYPEPRPALKTVWRHRTTGESPEEQNLSLSQAKSSGQFIAVQEYQTKDKKYEDAKMKRDFLAALATYMIVFNLLEENEEGIEPVFKLKDAKKEVWDEAFKTVEDTLQSIGISINQLQDLFEKVNSLDSFRD